MIIEGKNIKPADLARMSVKEGLNCLDGVARRVTDNKYYHRLGVILQDLVYNAGEAAKSGVLTPYAKQDLHDSAVEIAMFVTVYRIAPTDKMGKILGFIVAGLEHMLGAHASADKTPVDFVGKGRTIPLRALLPPPPSAHPQ